MPVKPGLYQVRIASRDAKSKRMGGATEWIEVPDLSKGNLTMSGLFVSELKAGQSETQAAADAFKLGNLSVDRRMAKTSKLLFLTYIYNAAPGTSAAPVPDLVTQIRVFSSLKPLLTTVLRKVSTEGLTDLTRIPYSAEIPLKNMAAGRYLLQITTTDRIAKTSTTQSVNFEVE